MSNQNRDIEPGVNMDASVVAPSPSAFVPKTGSTSSAGGGAAIPHAEGRNPIDVLADEYSVRLRAGESPYVDEYVRRLPESESAIRSLFATIAMVERMSHQQYSVKRTKPRVLDREEVIGDFRIQREIGRGGMGVVYLAMQCSLERRVALKVLASGIADSPKQLQRFRREAESASRLHHTNIVPVYGIGEENGVHFYAMQFIDGITLADAIESESQRVTGDATADFSRSSTANERFGSSSNAHFKKEGSEPASASTNDRTLIFSVDSDVAPSCPNQDESSDVEQNPNSTDDVGRQNKSGVEHRRFAEFHREAMFSDRNSAQFFREIANLAAQVADALNYAHEHGVLHRDIKPSNLMLDQSGAVWIMDFGLVKVEEQQDLTKTGEIVGTVRYMAPEQLDGRADTRTDIYSLGLTLYELLTLKPAFDGDSVAALSQRLQGRDIVRPRLINPRIPRDLETIVLRATAREPSARYATATALAEDLRRFCEDRPILARRSSYAERLWRWSWRNPELAMTTSSIILLLGMIAVVTTMGRLRVERAYAEAKSAQSVAEQAQTRAEENLDKAISAFDSIMENVTSRGVPRSLAIDISPADDGLAQTPLSTADALLLDRLLEFYRGFASQSEDSGRLRLRVADAHHRAGTILVRLGRLKEAEQDLRKAVELLASVGTDDEPNRIIDVAVKSASIQNEIGEVILRRGEFHETFKAHLEARATLNDLPESCKTNPAVRFEFARSTDLLASIDIRSGSDEGPSFFPGRRLDGEPPRFPDGMRPPGPPGDHGPPLDNDRQGFPPKFDRMVPDERRIGPPPGGREPLSDRLKRAMLPTGSETHDGPEFDMLASALLSASDDFRALAIEFPENLDYQFRLAQCLRHRLVHAASRKNSVVAKETFDESVSILERLAINNPDEPKFQFELADTLTQAVRAQSTSDAKTSLDRSDQIATELTQRFPNATEYQLLHGIVLARKATLQTISGDHSQAKTSLNQSIEILKTLAEKFPDQGVIQIPLAKSSLQLGDLLRTTASENSDPTADLNLSRSELQQAIDRFEKYLGKDASNPAHPKPGPFNFSIIFRLIRSQVQTLEALNLGDEAVELQKKFQEHRDPRRLPPLR